MPPSKSKPRRAARPVRVAVIGAGARAVNTHYPCLQDLAEAEVVALAELDDNRLHTTANTFAIKGRYTNYQEMIEREKPEAVYAILPPQQLYDVAATVLDRGCHLFIEKPPALNAEQVRQLALLARKRQVRTAVAFQRRYSPLLRQGKALVERHGPVHTAHAAFYKNWVGGSPYYRGAIDMLTCDGIHAVDTLRYLCGGEVVGVASDSRRLDAGHWNMHLALVRFSSGATGVLLVNFMAGRRSFTVEIHGPGSSFYGDPEEGGRLFADNQVEPAATLDPFTLSSSREAYRAFGAYDASRHFLQCVQTEQTPETCLEDAVKTMELVERIYGGQI